MSDTFEGLPNEKKERILNESMRIFTEYGFEAASTNLLTERLGISKGSLFKYFSSKLGLYRYLSDRAGKLLTEYIDENVNLEGKDWLAVILEYASAEFDFLIKDQHTYSFFRRLVKDLETDSVEEIKKSLIKKSQLFLEKIYGNLNLEPIILEHITFIVKGYNDSFIKTDKVYSQETKIEYLDGLKKHLALIKTGGRNDC